MESDESTGSPLGTQPEFDERARADERRCVARELHDGTSQLLVVIQLQLQRLKGASVSDAAPLIDELQQAIQEIRAQIRAVSDGG
jgi:signal transduction histidine kinase